MAAAVTSPQIKRQHSATRFSIDDILHNDKNYFCSIKKCGEINANNSNGTDHNNNTDSKATIDFRERLMKNMLSFDKLTNRKYSSFSEPPIINKCVTNISTSRADRNSLLFEEGKRFYEELALKLKIPAHTTTTPINNKNDHPQQPSSIEVDKLPYFDYYKNSDGGISPSSQRNRQTPPSIPEYRYNALNYRSSSITASTHLSKIARYGAVVNEEDTSLNEYRVRNFAPSPRSISALPLPIFSKLASGASSGLEHHRRKSSDVYATADIYSGCMSQRESSAPYYYTPNRHRNPYNFRQHCNDPYDLHLSKCSYDITTRQYNNKTSSSNFSGDSPTSLTLSPTLGDSPVSSPNKSPSSLRQCKGISDSGNLKFRIW